MKIEYHLSRRCVFVCRGGGGMGVRGGVCSRANYSVAYEETQTNWVSDFCDFVCSLFPETILFDFYCDCGYPLAFLLPLNMYCKTDFSAISPYKCILGVKIWPCCKRIKGQPTIIIWTNLVDQESPMLYTKDLAQSFLDFGEECLPYVGMEAISFNGSEPFEQIKIFVTSRSHVKSGENYKCGFREEVI